MPTIAILADTHIPSRATALPGWVRDEIRAADLTVHAGDFDSGDAFDEVDDLAAELVAVAGNMDPSLGLPAVAAAEVDGVTLAVTHGTGSLEGYRDRVRAAARDVDPDAVAVCGHTHEALDERHRGTRLVNPGSATGAAPADRTTMVRATVDGARLATDLLEG